MGTLAGKKIIFVIAPKLFRDEEYFQPKVMLQAQGAMIHTVAEGDPEEVTGTQGGKARTDQPFAQVGTQDYDALVLVGGEGSREYFTHTALHEWIRTSLEQKKVVGAICSAVGILAHAKVLEGRTITGFIEEKALIEKFGGIWLDQPVVVSDNIVTAQNQEAGIAFGETIGTLLATAR